MGRSRFFRNAIVVGLTSLAIFGAGLAGLATLRRRRRMKG
jgi:hypothetical protein